MCDHWLAVNKGDCQIERTLTVSHSFVASDPSILMQKHISQRLFEDHMWLSVSYRAKKSFFTRAQRLGACMATLFLAMISNCMLYKVWWLSIALLENLIYLPFTIFDVLGGRLVQKWSFVLLKFKFIRLWPGARLVKRRLMKTFI